MRKEYLVICCCRVRLGYMTLLTHYQVSPKVDCLQRRGCWCEIWKAFDKCKNAIGLKDINEERWGSTQRKGDQLEYLPTSLHCFSCSPEPADRPAPFPIFQGKLTESLDSPLSWAAQCQCGHLFLNLALSTQAALSHSLCCVERVAMHLLLLSAVKKFYFQVHFSGLELQLKQELW